MERFKQSILDLQKDVTELKQNLQTIRGSPPSRGSLHYSAASQEFGEYSLEELDTFRFITKWTPDGVNTFKYSYELMNPTPELTSYLRLQGKVFNTNSLVNPDDYESYCMGKRTGTPFVLTKEIQKCLESKLWEYICIMAYGYETHTPKPTPPQNGVKQIFETTIIIPFTHTYKIPPHISFYISPISDTPNGINSCTIKEITTKQAVFYVKYGNYEYRECTGQQKQRLQDNIDIIMDPNLKLHYSISGILEHNTVDNLLN